ncbi:DNA replication/repair protein RecF [Asticcacaulis solisilvae]|uniref:DNA replication/repair protein RecF n=1 Tax=Asticcacaulis solisilvae TaxID=1217274 RepID=UPI003FD898AF
MSNHALQSLSLTEFRSYERLDFALDGRSIYLFGQNGAGKTNLLEAVSVLNPGKGLRGAGFSDLGRRLPDEMRGRAWGVAATFGEGETEVRLATGSDPRDPNKRTVRIDGEPAPAARLIEHVRLIWLTPAQDRLFIEARSERLRFFDRLTYAAEPTHAAVVSAYEKALRERLKLLTDGPPDDAWLTLLEQKLGETGTAMILARRRAVEALQAEIETHAGPFPKADLGLAGDLADDLAGSGLNTHIINGFRQSRARDAAASRSLFGPHRMDFTVIHRDKNRPAAEGSTGEQKALLLNVILAQGARLAKAESSSPPILLLDEVAAHLDPGRRHALFDETHALGLQTLFTGTDQGLFDGLKSRALGVRVDGGQFVEFVE